jgi:hypothetical protein
MELRNERAKWMPDGFIKTFPARQTFRLAASPIWVWPGMFRLWLWCDFFDYFSGNGRLYHFRDRLVPIILNIQKMTIYLNYQTDSLNIAQWLSVLNV